MRDLIDKIAEGKNLTESEEEIFTRKILDLYEEHPNFITKHNRWKKIISWVSGYQSIPEPLSKSLIEQEKKRTRRLVFNRLRPFFRVMLSKLCSVSPQLGVIPNTDETEDLEAARLADLIVEYFYTTHDFDELRRNVFKWLLLTNQAYIRVFWDLSKRGLINYETKILTDEVGNVLGEVKEAIYEEGDVTFQVVSPFHCYPDPIYSDPNSWRWFIFVELVDAYDLAKIYNVDVDELTDEGVQRFTTLVATESRVATIDHEGEFSEINVSFDDKYGKTILKVEFWTPEIYAIIAGKKLLEYGVNPYRVIPFFGYEDQLIPIDFGSPNRSLNDPVLRDMIPIQREYNRFISLMSKHLEEFTRLKVAVPLNSLLDKRGLLEDQNIVLIFYDPQRGAIHQLRFDQIHPQTALFKKELENELSFVSGIHEVSFAQLPERASHASGTLVSLLLEQDDQTFDHLIKAVDKMFSKALRLGLEIVQENYTVSRLIKVAGRDRQVETIWFKGADLRGNTDVRVSTQLGLPRSRILRAEWILRLAQTGLIQDPKLILEMLEFGQARKLFEDVLLHERKANRENLEIEKNPDIDPASFHQKTFYDFDADDIHFRIHLRDRLSSKFERYTENQKQALEMHLRAHRERLEQGATATQQQAVALKQNTTMGLPADFLNMLVQQESLTPTSTAVTASGEIPE